MALPSPVPCAKFKKQKGDKKKTKPCRNCDLPKDVHKKKHEVSSTETVPNILAKYNIKGLQPLASEAEARREMTAGFRPAPPPAASQGGSSKSSVSAASVLFTLCPDLDFHAFRRPVRDEVSARSPTRHRERLAPSRRSCISFATCLSIHAAFG